MARWPAARDVVHGTIRTDVPQECITIGVPPYHENRDMTLGKALLLPLVTEHPEDRDGPKKKS